MGASLWRWPVWSSASVSRDLIAARYSTAFLSSSSSQKSLDCLPTAAMNAEFQGRASLYFDMPTIPLACN